MRARLVLGLNTMPNTTAPIFATLMETSSAFAAMTRHRKGEKVARAMDMFANTVSADITHHPAMSIPCGMRDGLPVGMMLTGKHFDEPSIYRAAHAFEQSGDWKEM